MLTKHLEFCNVHVKIFVPKSKGDKYQESCYAYIDGTETAVVIAQLAFSSDTV